MSDWDELRSLVASSKERWSSFRAEGRSWQDRLAARQAIESRRQVPGRVQRVLSQNDRNAPAGRDQEWRLWRGGHVLVRSEYFIGRELVTVVAQGPRWWRWSRTLGATSGGGPGRPVRYMLGPAGVLVYPEGILDNVEAVKIASTKFLDREAIAISARPTAERPRDRMALREAGTGADEYELIIDAERGTVLSVSASRNGQPFRLTAATEVDFDETFTPQLFSPESSEDARMNIARPMQRVGLGEVKRAIDFPVYAPDPSPSPVDPHVAIFEVDRRGLGPKRVVVTYVINEENVRGQLRVTSAGTALPRRGEAWQRREGCEICSETSDRITRLKVRRQIGSVHVELESSILSMERLVGLARSLAVIGSAD